MPRLPPLLLLLLLLLPPTLSLKPNAPPPPPDDLSSATLRQANPPCGATCRFRLCVSNGSGPPRVLPPSSFTIFNQFNTVSNPFICLPSEPDMGRVLVYSVPFVAQGSNLTPLTAWSPAGLDTPFTRASVRFRNIPGTVWDGVSAGRPRGNQWEFLNRRCMVVLIRAYEVVEAGSGRGRGRVVVPRSLENCVAFRTLAPFLQVQARWDTEDDFDLEVNEPDRSIVDWVTPRSSTGRLNGDNNVDGCGTGLNGGRENVLFDFNRNLQRGQYGVRLNHFQMCGARATRWNVTVVQGGIPTRTFSGTSNNSTGIAPAFGRTVLDERFEYS